MKPIEKAWYAAWALIGVAWGGVAFGADIYASSTASGSNNGTSWTNAYTNLQTAINALSAGDVLYVNAPKSTPFHGTFTATDKDNCVLIGDRGPDRATWLFGGINGASFTDVGGGTNDFSKSGFAAKPYMVSYDFKQDDAAGTTTGCAVTAEHAAAVGRLGWPAHMVRQWYGFLVENTGTPTTPGDGQWGYSAGTLYVDPPGAPSLATATPLIVYSDPAITHGIYLVDCDHTRVSGFTVYWYPVANGNDGYAVRGDNCTDVEISRNVAIASGWHHIGFAGGYSGNVGNYDCRINDNFMNGCTGDESAFTTNCIVFFQHTAPTRWGNNSGVRNVCIPTPRLLSTGLPTMSNWKPNPLLSHATSGSSMTGIAWTDNVCIDFTTGLVAKGATNTQRGTIISAANTPTPANPLLQSDYPIQSKRNLSIGRPFWDRNAYVAYEGDIVDRSGHGASTGNQSTMVSGTGANVNVWAKGCTVLTGDYADAMLVNIDSGDRVYLQENRVLMQGTVNRKGFVLEASDTGTTDNIYLYGNEFESDDNVNHSPILAGGTIYTNNIRDVISNGLNRFGLGLEGSLQHTNPGNAPQTMTWWRANVTGASTDAGLIDLGWGSTATARVEFLRQAWYRDSLPPRTFLPQNVVISQ